MTFEDSKITLNYIVKNIENSLFALNILERANLINLCSFICPKCHRGYTKKTKRSRHVLGFVMLCDNIGCRKEYSILKNDWMAQKNIKKLLYVVAAFLSKKTIACIIRDSGLNEKTVYSYIGFIRNAISEKINNMEIKLGGENIEVEIDEAHLFTRKFNRGNILASEQIWIFGIVERVSKKCFLKTVRQRNANELFEVFNSHVLPGTLVFSDGWRGYSRIKEFFTVKSVNHRLHFVDPINNEIHTQNIERLWRSVKEGMGGVSVEKYDEHLNEFVYRKNYLTGNFFENLVELLKFVF